MKPLYENEEWRPIPGYEGFYEASNIGRIRSVGRTVQNHSKREFRAGRVLSPGVQNSGHLFVQCSKLGVVRSRRVHRLVAEAFLGVCPEGLHVNHIDGNPTNNVVSNLEYVTHARNMQHANELGLTLRGEKHQNAKLTSDDVREIRRLRASGLCFREIAERFGVTRKTASRACSGEHYSDVK